MKIQQVTFLTGLVVLLNMGISQVVKTNFWGNIQRIEFSNDELPPNLYSMFTEDSQISSLQYCLPAS